MPNLNRRGFIKRTAAAVGRLCPITCCRESDGIDVDAKATPLRLGGYFFCSTDDPEGLALAHRKLGHRAAYCPKISLNDSANTRRG